MIRFLLKGILRDKSRSVLPILIISIGVALTVLLSGYIKGVFGDVITQNARFETGHVKIMTRAYAENIDQLPNDAALLETEALIGELKTEYPDMDFVQRIKFGGLIDIPDTAGNSKAQGPTIGLSFDILSQNTNEVKRMNLKNSIVQGRIPQNRGEALIGEEFSKKLKVKIGDVVTFFGTTMNGSMTFYAFKICGTIKFGLAALDKMAFIIDLKDAQMVLDMEDAAGEILGFLPNDVYNDMKTIEISETFNQKYKNSTDEFAPVMKPLKAQNDLEEVFNYGENMSGLFVFLFIIAMSIVLWNTGLLGGLRRYKEFGIRLALGEPKSGIYRSMILEAILVGLIGSCIGTLIGLGGTLYMQEVGIDISEYMKESTMIMPNTVRSKISSNLFYIGFIPGVLAMVIGNALSGIGIYKRETARLFKELEV
ncbi:MAG: FtsX-like permease family protein [Flavobacteriales bacterium]|nr:FtsX-like permease family protein [Flavobacteriales bacterium]